MSRGTRVVMIVAALTLAVDETLRSKNHSLKLFSALCAERIVVLLNDPHEPTTPTAAGPRTASGSGLDRQRKPRPAQTASGTIRITPCRASFSSTKDSAT